MSRYDTKNDNNAFVLLKKNIFQIFENTFLLSTYFYFNLWNNIIFYVYILSKVVLVLRQRESPGGYKC